MEAIKNGGKVIAALIKYVCFAIFLIPYLIYLLVRYLVQLGIDYDRYEADVANVRNGTAKERRAVQAKKNEMDWKRNRAFADSMFDYCSEHLFGKESHYKKSRRKKSRR